MPHLPVASAAKKIQGEQLQLIEVQYSISGWNVQGDAATDDLDTIEDQIKAAKTVSASKGYTAIVLIEADAAVAFKHIRAVVRTSAKAGIDEFLFAVRQHPMHPDTLKHGLALDTYISLGHGCGPPNIAPMFLKIDRQGSIYLNTGPDQELINSDPESRDLSGLSNRIEAYQAVARAGAQAPVFQIWVDGEAPYQRVIDIINLLRSHGIEREFFTDLTDDDIHGSGRTGCGGGGIRYIPPRAPPAPSLRNPITE